MDHHRNPIIWLVFVCACEGGLATPPGYQGVIEHDERRIGFEVGGRMRTLAVARGDRVEAGEVVAELDDGLEAPWLEVRRAEVRLAEAQLALLSAGARPAEVRVAQLEVAAANARLAQLHDHFVRAQTLEASGAIARAERDDLSREMYRAQAQRDAARQRVRVLVDGARSQELAAAAARLDAARASLATLEARLARFILRAPIAGRVVDVVLEPGEMVAPGASVFSLADRMHPYVEVFVPQNELAQLRVGTPATIRVDGDSHHFSGRIEHIGHRAEFTPRYLFSPEERANLVMRVRVRFDDPDDRAHAGVPTFVEFGDAGAR